MQKSNNAQLFTKTTEPTLFKSETKCKRRERACPARTLKKRLRQTSVIRGRKLLAKNG